MSNNKDRKRRSVSLTNPKKLSRTNFLPHGKDERPHRPTINHSEKQNTHQIERTNGMYTNSLLIILLTCPLSIKINKYDFCQVKHDDLDRRLWYSSSGKIRALAFFSSLVTSQHRLEVSLYIVGNCEVEFRWEMFLFFFNSSRGFSFAAKHLSAFDDLIWEIASLETIFENWINW